MTPCFLLSCSYRRWKLGDDIDLIVRCEHDGVMTGANGEVSFINIKTLNEWDSRVRPPTSLPSCRHCSYAPYGALGSCESRCFCPHCPGFVFVCLLAFELFLQSGPCQGRTCVEPPSVSRTFLWSGTSEAVTPPPFSSAPFILLVASVPRKPSSPCFHPAPCLAPSLAQLRRAPEGPLAKSCCSECPPSGWALDCGTLAPQAAPALGAADASRGEGSLEAQ